MDAVLDDSGAGFVASFSTIFVEELTDAGGKNVARYDGSESAIFDPMLELYASVTSRAGVIGDASGENERSGVRG